MGCEVVENARGQGSTEYLVVLGAVLLVSLVTVNLLGSFPSSGSATKEQQSKAYWSGTTPFAITTARVTNGTITLSVSNKLTERAYLTAIEVQDGYGNNATVMTPNQILNAGEETTLTNFSFTLPNPCNGKAVGSAYEFKAVSFIYTQGPITGIRQQGAQPLVGKCSEFTCGETVTFTYRGSSVTYGTVTSQAGRCFMDRNLGASRAATSVGDLAAYGDYFQWGRLDDGHQSNTSGTTSTLSATNSPGHSNFIIAPTSPYDWLSPRNDNLWQGVNGINNPCPSGWRLPTIAEWSAENTAGSWTNYYSAYASPLKLTVTGARVYSSASLSNVGVYGHYWSSSIYGANAYEMEIGSGAADTTNSYRAYGISVRCIKN
ncbi:MAG: hypothetical protein WCX64_03330 [Candidatus Micrarchaeia archaeon]